MLKNELITLLAEKSGTTKKNADTFLQSLIDVMSEAMQRGDKVQLLGFGTFEVSEVDARDGRNPNTGEKLTIPAYKKIRFKSSSVVKDLINN